MNTKEIKGYMSIIEHRSDIIYKKISNSYNKLNELLRYTNISLNEFGSAIDDTPDLTEQSERFVLLKLLEQILSELVIDGFGGDVKDIRNDFMLRTERACKYLNASYHKKEILNLAEDVFDEIM